jgi:hypothetical protein
MSHRLEAISGNLTDINFDSILCGSIRKDDGGKPIGLAAM